MSKKQCPKCNEDNSISSTSCLNCGTSLKDATIIKSEVDTSIYNKKIISVCPKCNEKINSNTRTCKNCGEFIAKTSTDFIESRLEEHYLSRKDGSDSSCLLIIATILFPIVGLIVGGVYTANDDYSMQNTGKTLLLLGIILSIVYAVIYFIALY